MSLQTTVEKVFNTGIKTLPTLSKIEEIKLYTNEGSYIDNHWVSCTIIIPDVYGIELMVGSMVRNLNILTRQYSKEIHIHNVPLFTVSHGTYNNGKRATAITFNIFVPHKAIQKRRYHEAFSELMLFIIKTIDLFMREIEEIMHQLISTHITRPETTARIFEDRVRKFSTETIKQQL